MALLMSAVNYAQKQPDASVKLDSKITDINLHEVTGVAVVTTNGGVYGVKNTGEKIWEFKESGFVKGLNSLGQDGGSSFTEIALSPFGQFNQTVFNIKTGNKIIDDKTNAYKKIIDNKFVGGKKAILFFAKTDKKQAKLFLVNIENDAILWQANIETNKKLESLFGAVGGISDFIENNDRVAFIAGKTVFLVSKNDGKVILSEKYDAGKLFFSEDNKSLIAVENKNSSLIGGALKAGLTMGISLMGKKVIGKELLAFDVNTGKEVWKRPIKLDEGFVDYQFVDGKLFVMHKDGAKLYDYHTGEDAWRKEFKKSKVKRAEKTDEGYMVYYKNKKHLVDNSGKKIWKKSQKVIKNVDFEADDEEDFTTFTYDNGTIFVTPFRIEYYANGNEKRVYKIKINEEKDKITYDDKNKNLILLSGKRLYILNPDSNLGKEQVKKIDFNDSDVITTVEARDDKYFINGNWEYVITDLNGNVIKKEYFKQPGEGLRHLKNIGSTALALGGMATQVSGVMNATHGATLYGAGTFVGQQNVAKEGERRAGTGVNQVHTGGAMIDVANYLWDGERYNAFKAVKNSAFFYTKKDGKKVLLQVNKDSGEIESTFEFGVNEPKYKIDKPAKKIYFRKGDELKIFSYN